MRTVPFVLAVILTPLGAFAWNNGGAGSRTPGYATHDWIAEHAMMLLPENERAWLEPHRDAYLLGTEAPDNANIPASCGTPHTGYDDRGSGHSVEWAADFSDFVSDGQGGKKDRAARRAREEYNKAAEAFEEGDPAAAAFFLGAMAHYIGDVAQYGHTYPDERIHSLYEGWAERRTDTFDQEQVFESHLALDSLVRRRPYTAVKRISLRTLRGEGEILTATEMDRKYAAQERDEEFIASVGASLNLAVNELADVLHRFWLNEVNE